MDSGCTVGGANTNFRLHKTLAQAVNSTSTAPYNCTVPANGTVVNQYDGLVHEEGSNKTKFLDSGCTVGGANTSFRLAKKTLAQNASAPAELTNSTQPADLEIARAPYNCTAPANGSKVNKFDGLIHDESGKRNFSDDGCIVGGVNDSYKYTGHPLNKTKDANFTQP